LSATICALTGRLNSTNHSSTAPADVPACGLGGPAGLGAAGVGVAGFAAAGVGAAGLGADTTALPSVGFVALTGALAAGTGAAEVAGVGSQGEVSELFLDGPAFDAAGAGFCFLEAEAPSKSSSLAGSPEPASSSSDVITRPLAMVVGAAAGCGVVGTASGGLRGLCAGRSTGKLLCGSQKICVEALGLRLLSKSGKQRASFPQSSGRFFEHVKFESCRV